MTQVEFLRLVNDDLLTAISIDVGFEISRISSAMIHKYLRGQWLYDITQQVVTIKRWFTGKEESVEGFQDLDFKPRITFGSELRAAIDKLKTDEDQIRPSYEIWQPQYWRRRLPISFLSFEAANGTWIAEWFCPPSLAQTNDFILYDIIFNSNIETSVEKRLQLHVRVSDLSENPAENLERFQPEIIGLLESPDNFASNRFQG